MKYFKTFALMFVVFCFASSLVPLAAWSGDLPHPKTYLPTMSDLLKHKKFYDDPSPFLKTFGPKQVLPPELWAALSYDVDEMKDAWAELVGFRSPEIVGKIAPEIKPGKYTYKDLGKYPGLKDLMWDHLYGRIKPGGPPHVGNIPDFEIVPTRQYYFALPVAEATEKNMGKTKLDDAGYLITETWAGGYPYPKPSGKFKAQEIMYNLEKRYLSWGLNFYILSWINGYTKNLVRDFDGRYTVAHIRLAGRCLLPPYGWYDGRAEKRGEMKNFLFGFQAPRDVAGTVQSALYYLEPTKADQLMLYIPSLRRVRKMSATDTQDPIMGQDVIYDDNEGWMQKLSPVRYPYNFEVLDEREFLIPAPSWDGSEYIESDGLGLRNMKFERRPMYVVKLTQQDPNYVYSYRIFYIDKETFNFIHIENYDQKGRLYRTWDSNYGFHPEMGISSWSGGMFVFHDHIDTHSAIHQCYQLPAFWTRKDISLSGLLRKSK